MKLLVADDSPVFRDVLQRMLTSWGFDVIVACDGYHAWDCLQTESAPKIVVLDWMMPGMDGIELCQLIRSSDSQRRVHHHAHSQDRPSGPTRGHRERRR